HQRAAVGGPNVSLMLPGDDDPAPAAIEQCAGDDLAAVPIQDGDICSDLRPTGYLRQLRHGGAVAWSRSRHDRNAGRVTRCVPDSLTGQICLPLLLAVEGRDRCDVSALPLQQQVTRYGIFEAVRSDPVRTIRLTGGMIRIIPGVVRTLEETCRPILQVDRQKLLVPLQTLHTSMTHTYIRNRGFPTARCSW